MIDCCGRVKKEQLPLANWKSKTKRCCHKKYVESVVNSVSFFHSNSDLFWAINYLLFSKNYCQFIYIMCQCVNMFFFRKFISVWIVYSSSFSFRSFSCCAGEFFYWHWQPEKYKSEDIILGYLGLFVNLNGLSSMTAQYQIVFNVFEGKHIQIILVIL